MDHYLMALALSRHDDLVRLANERALGRRPVRPQRPSRGASTAGLRVRVGSALVALGTRIQPRSAAIR